MNVQGLKTYFDTEQGVVKAVDGIDFVIHGGETLGVVGESGCGKSMTALSIMRLFPSPPGRIAGGKIWFRETELTSLGSREMRAIRGCRISMIFQEPMTSLNPVYSVGSQIVEAIRLHQDLSKSAAKDRAIQMLSEVGIASPERRFHEYPHQMSGGMRQRVMIAMALSCNPSLLIADEPTTALDVTIQAQILDLMNSLKEKFGAAIMFITHDLGVIAETARRVIVMYAGKIVEQGPVEGIFENPLHPYTKGLLGSIPSDKAIREKSRLTEIKGMVPSLHDLPAGCAFHERCMQKISVCQEKLPQIFEPQRGHQVACWLYQRR
ncbi:MAG TPA: ABC transporter ATP-binding protein [Thermodesulfobacteriota bacterium]|nr:ABC transporter ATP-binding protein [Thermodesulfobacteriota bacterium]